MPTLKYRDPTTGQMVPLLGGMTQAEADARYLKKTGGTVTGPLVVPTPASSAALAPKSYVDARKVPAGTIVMYASNTPPAGWLLCNGTLLSRSEYQDLFAAIGVTYGVGDGVSTFAAPNMAGRCIVGVDPNIGEFATLGDVSRGANTITLAHSQVPSAWGYFQMHNAGNSTGVYNSGGHLISSIPPADGVGYRTGYLNNGSASIGQVHFNFGFGDQPHNNIQPSRVVQYIVKA